MSYKFNLLSLAFLLVLPLALHLLLSPWIFVPLDDGFNLAYSRRLLDGEVPHRDFISIRPVGSALLHLPFVALAEDYAYWVSRLFVWFQFACISWIWVLVVDRTFKLKLGSLGKLAFGLISFVLCVHFSPIMAWHTTDGLFLASIGTFFALQKSAPTRLLGFFVIGLAYLCKQNFFAFALAAVVLLGHWRQPKYWLAVLLPGMVYLAYLGATGAFFAFVAQITSQSSLLEVGVFNYVFSYAFLWGVLIGLAGAALLISSGSAKVYNFSVPFRSVGAVLIYGYLTGVSALMLGSVYKDRLSSDVWVWTLLPGRTWPNLLPYALFGTALGATVYFILSGFNRKGAARIGLLAVVLAWTASISVGYPTPALASGLLSLLLLSYTRTSNQSAIPRPEYRVLSQALLIALTLVSATSFLGARYLIISSYFDGQGVYKAGDVFPGARLLKVNKATYELFSDLQNAINFTSRLRPEARYAILPDFAGYWVESAQANPLDIDWPLSIELNTGALYGRALGQLTGSRGKTLYIVQKINLWYFTPYNDVESSSLYKIVGAVRKDFTKVGETDWFEIYE